MNHALGLRTVSELSVHAAAVTDGGTIGSAWTPTFSGALRLSCCFSVAAALKVTISDGSNTQEVLFNEGNSLGAGVLYNDSLAVRQGFTYTFSVVGAAATVHFTGQFVTGGVL